MNGEKMLLTLTHCPEKVIMRSLLILLSSSAVFGLYEACDFYQELLPGQPYYIYSPNYPRAYKPGQSCRWYAVSPPGTQVFLVCENFSLPQSPGCSSDRLSISATGDPDINDANNYCGTGGFSAVSADNKMMIALLTSPRGRGGAFLCSIGVQNAQFPTDPEDCDCGRRNTLRIVGGRETGVNEFPMMAGLVDGIEKGLFCGATIISRLYAITAAHCVINKTPNTIGLLVGDHDIAVGNDTTGAEILLIDKIVVHPNFDSTTQDNDIAIVGVNRPITFNIKVGPACLPFTNRRQSFVGETVEAVGWGTVEYGGMLSSKLLSVDLTVISMNQCKNTFGDKVSENQICTYTPSKDACQRDSGGPLLWTEPKDKRLKLLGIISYGIACASDTPSVNSRITKYIPWILENADDEYCISL